MLPKGSITKIYKHYFASPRYKDEVVRALGCFLNQQNLKSDGSFETDEEGGSLFNEWFLYDFVLKNGRTVLMDFVIDNPLHLSSEDRLFYEILLETNEFGLYEVISIDINRGLKIKNLQTKREVYVFEKKLTYQIRPGVGFFGRIGKVGDHFELVGVDSFSVGELNNEAKEILSQKKFKMTPKDAYEIWKNE